MILVEAFNLFSSKFWWKKQENDLGGLLSWLDLLVLINHLRYYFWPFVSIVRCYDTSYFSFICYSIV